MISDHIYDVIPPKRNLKMAIPILNLMHFCTFVSNCSIEMCIKRPTKCDVINDVKLFPKVFCRIYCRKFLTSNQMSYTKVSALEIEDLI